MYNFCHRYSYFLYVFVWSFLAIPETNKNQLQYVLIKLKTITKLTSLALDVRKISEINSNFFLKGNRKNNNHEITDF